MHSLNNSLEQLLSETEDAEAFARVSERSQRSILNGVLGEGSSDLVEDIIQSVKRVSQIPTGQALCVKYSFIFIIICSHSLTELRWPSNVNSHGQNNEL